MTESVLVCSVNWLGDCIMSMPAVAMFRSKYPETRIVVLAKSALTPLWSMNETINEVFPFDDSLVGTVRAAVSVRRMGVDRAYIFPNSFRSALIPAMARIKRRIGVPGDHRVFLLTERIDGFVRTGRRHQLWEYMAIMGLCGDEESIAACDMFLSDWRCPVKLEKTVSAPITELLDAMPTHVTVGFVPGSARGPSKQWPAEHFIKLGRLLIDAYNCRILLFGTSDERKHCERISAGIERNVINLSGKTSLPETATLMKGCDVVVTNDSGGMHLAAAAGARVMAIYGLTDPEITGPIGNGHRILSAETDRKGRDIARDSKEARDALYSIAPDRVLQVLAEMFGVRR
ncbi:MAG: lipopolysaccharide heptosyltransferase II [Lentisphaerae bacterium]|nr:lipopolysaccharide heptosyltransferase II [Lentisphaerota bacterium]